MCRLFTTKEVATKTHYSVRTIRRFYNDGKLTGIQAGNDLRFSFSDLSKWLGRERAIDLFATPPIDAGGVAR